MSQDPRDTAPGDMPHDDELTRAYRALPAEEPRAEIDRAILDAAHAAPSPRRAVVHRLRWAIPLAAAAGVVLTVTLTRMTPDRGATGQLAAVPARDDAAKADNRAVAAKKSKAETGAGRENEERANVRATQFARQAPAAPAPPPPEALAQQAPAAAPAAQEPPAATAGGEAAVKEKMKALGDAADSAPASPEDEIASQRALMDKAALERQKDQPPAPWPFGLEGGMSANDACLAVAQSLHVACSYVGSAAEIPLPAPALVDRGPWQGRLATSLVLRTSGDVLVGVDMDVQAASGGSERVHLVSRAAR